MKACDAAAVTAPTKSMDSREIILAAVAQKLGKRVEEMTDADRRRLKQLSLAGKAVTDLSALAEIVPNLTWLSLAYTRVADIRPLSQMHALVWLDFEGTNVCDLSPLAELKLTTLGIVDTPACVDDLAVLAFEKRGVKVYR